MIDTAGIDDLLKGNLDNEIKFQTDLAIDDADLIIFVIDGRAGVLPAEKTFSKKLKAINKPIIIANIIGDTGLLLNPIISVPK